MKTSPSQFQKLLTNHQEQVLEVQVQALEDFSVEQLDVWEQPLERDPQPQPLNNHQVEHHQQEEPQQDVPLQLEECRATQVCLQEVQLQVEVSRWEQDWEPLEEASLDQDSLEVVQVDPWEEVRADHLVVEVHQVEALEAHQEVAQDLD